MQPQYKYKQFGRIFPVTKIHLQEPIVRMNPLELNLDLIQEDFTSFRFSILFRVKGDRCTVEGSENLCGTSPADMQSVTISQGERIVFNFSYPS